MTSYADKILDLYKDGYSIKNISEQFKISEKTVRNHISNVIGKLGVTSRTQAILELIKIKELKI